MKTKIAILSDTHDLLRPEIISFLDGCELILHGGDISSQSILDKLEQIAPVRVVRGNNDKEWAEHLPEHLDFEIAGLRFYMTHKKKDLPGDLSPYDIVITGHSHQYANIWIDHADGHRTLLLNPGSCGPRRFYQAITMAMLTIDDDGWIVKRIEVPHKDASRKDVSRKDAPRNEGAQKKGSHKDVSNKDASHEEDASRPDSADMRKIVATIVGDTQKNRSVDDIARRHKLDRSLVEQIVRLYLTHPGVTVDGILTKMGL